MVANFVMGITILCIV